MKRTITSFLLFLVAGTASAVTHTVTNAAGFNALPTLNAGDRVVLASGDYGALDKTLVSSIGDDATATNNPVLVYAAVPGGARVTAPSKIILRGRGITLAGLDFVSGSGMIDNGSTSATYLIRLDTNSRYMKLSNLRFKDCVAGDDYGNWIVAYGYNHLIEYCTFEGKDEPVANATISLKRNTAELGITTPRNHIIRRCYFGPRECSTSANGYETLRIGDSSSQAHNMSVHVLENVFYRAIWRGDGQKPNDMEIISNKSADNVFRGNTFLESYGQLTLRHGDRAVVEQNYFLGGGRYSGDSITLASPNDYQGGVRIIGTDHMIRNNYFANLIGGGYRSALCLMGGTAGFDDGNGSGGDNGYEAADNAQILHNTFVDCEEMNLGFYGSGGDTLPANCSIHNNAWHGAGSNEAIVRSNGFNVGPSEGNYIYEPGSGDLGWTGLGGTYTQSTSPDITEAFDNYLIPAAGSPLLNAASGSGSVANDVRGVSRSGATADIGSFEREVAGLGRGPLARSEVGPLFDGGPSGTYPAPIGLDPSLPPSGNFDLTQYYLTMPVDATNGYAGEAINIDTATLSAGYENAPWFHTDDSTGEMRFEVPWNGAVRGSSSSPRSELRETYPDGNLRNWTPLDDGGVHELSAICRVLSVGDGKVSIGQIHGKVPDTPTVIMRYNNTLSPARIDVSIYNTADGGDGISWMYFDAPALGGDIDYTMRMTGSDTEVEFSCTVNGETQTMLLTQEFDAWKTATFYFKVGAYYTVPDSGEWARVAYSKVEMARGELAIATSTLPNGAIGQAYSQTLQTLNGAGAPAWSVPDGALPPGLSLAAGGTISGTPTTNGVFLFTAQVLDGGEIALQPLSLAVDTTGSSTVYLSEDFEVGQTVGDPPNGASVLRPSSNDADNFVKIVDAAGNPAGAGNGVGFRDNGSASTLLSYNFVASANDQVSVARADFSFAQLSAGGSSSHFIGIGFGEFNVSQSLNSSSRRFTDARFYADGTIDFRSAGGSESTGNPIPGGSNELSIFVNDHDAMAVDYIGPDENSYSLPANSVAYWLNGARVLMGNGEGYTEMDLGDATGGGSGTVGTTEDNLGKFGFYSATSYTDLDFVIDDLRIASLTPDVEVALAKRGVYAVGASADDGNIPENTLDGSLATRWSAQGEGQWIEYDLGVPQNLHEVWMAFFNGDIRSSYFEVEVSVDGQHWSQVLSLQSSSGTNAALEQFSFNPTSGRYLRIIGQGNSANDWNSITETEIWGVPFEVDPATTYADLMIDSGVATVAVDSTYGPLYQLQMKDSLTQTNWTDLVVQPGTGAMVDLTDPDALQTNRFYRLLILP